MLSLCAFDISVGVGAFVIGLSQISSFFSCSRTFYFRTSLSTSVTLLVLNPRQWSFAIHSNLKIWKSDAPKVPKQAKPKSDCVINLFNNNFYQFLLGEFWCSHNASDPMKSTVVLDYMCSRGLSGLPEVILTKSLLYEKNLYLSFYQRYQITSKQSCFCLWNLSHDPAMFTPWPLELLCYSYGSANIIHSFCDIWGHLNGHW